MKKTAMFIIFLFVFSSISSIMTSAEEDTQPIASLVLAVEPNELIFQDIALKIAEHLAEINIDVEVKISSDYSWWPFPTNDWDMKFLETQSLYKRDMRDYYSSEGPYNVFGLIRDMPYGNDSENMQNELLTITDLEEEYVLRENWTELFMDKLLPLLPMYSPRRYIVSWGNILGYQARWELAQSLPYMQFDGVHTGQISLEELNIAADEWWSELNSLFIQDKSDQLISSLISEPIVVNSPDLAPLTTGIVHNWEQISDTHYKFYLRDNIFWNPSFNITTRTSSSEDLDPTNTSSLMIGLKGEFSNGTNQQLTANDAVFSFLAYSNPSISDHSLHFEWLSECYVDQTDPLAFHIIVDQNPKTIEHEPYNQMWEELNRPILPEFFLNSTSNETATTTGGQEYFGLYNNIINTPEWMGYSVSAFGLGKYRLDYFDVYHKTVLERSPTWFEIGSIDGSTQDLDIPTINIFRIDDTEQLPEFKDGKLDIIDVTNFPVDRKTMQSDSAYDVSTFVALDFSYLAFNLRRPFIGGVDNYNWVNQTDYSDYTIGCAVRKAICHAIDRDTINQELFDGEFFVAHRPVPHIWIYYGPYPCPIMYDYDLELAWQWLERAGYVELDKSDFSLITVGIALLAMVVFSFSKRKNKKKLE
ncbi:MAG: ABC transporter substrate-binding protein [Candidatus Heimdallarchaeaceae archaeon]